MKGNQASIPTKPRHAWGSILRPEQKHRLVHGLDLLRVLVGRDIKIRYKRSVLGTAWSLLNPLLQLCVFSTVFQLLLPLNIPNYALFLFIGLLAWTWFQSSLMAATTSIVDNRELLRQPNFPQAILPVVMVTTNLVHFVLALPILFGIMALMGHPLSATALVLPLIILLQYVLTVSISYFMATLHVTFRDTQYLLGVFLLLGFYLTPIFYDSGALAEPYRTALQLNPMFHIIDAYRAILLRGEMPGGIPLLSMGIASGISLAWGYRLFVRASHTFVEEL